MGVCDPTAKDLFAAQTRPQNLGRLLLRIVQHVFVLLNHTTSDAAGGWRMSSGMTLDKADLRLYFWQATREARELVLKAIALIDFVESPLFKRYGDRLVDVVGHILDGRETIRRRGVEFAAIQWPPTGLCPPPQPPWPVEVAMDTLFGGGSYPRLPAMMEEAVKQVGEPDPATILRLPREERSAIRRRVEDEVVAMWALSQCPKRLASLRFERNEVVFSVPNEFSVSLIFDFQKCQILEGTLTAGRACGLEVPPLINLGFCNVLRQGIGLLEVRHKFTVEKLKRQIRERWREAVATWQQLHRVAPEDEHSALLKARLSALKHEVSTMLDSLRAVLLFEGQQRRHRSPGSMLTAGRCFEEQPVVSPPDYFYELFCIGRWISGEIILSILRDQVLRSRNFPKSFLGGIYKYVETGAGNLALVAKAPEEDQRPYKSYAKHVDDAVSVKSGKTEISSVTLGCGNSGFGTSLAPLVSTSAKGHTKAFRALDILFLSQFDFTCGGLLTPLLWLALATPRLVPCRDEVIAMLSPETSNDHAMSGASPLMRPVLEHVDVPADLPDVGDEDLGSVSSCAPEAGAVIAVGETEKLMEAKMNVHAADGALPSSTLAPQIRLRGSGAILRFAIRSDTGVWSTILWPLTPLAWLLRHASDISRTQAKDVAPVLSLQSALETALPFDLEALRAHVTENPSFAYIQTFSADRLELSSWMGHCCTCLSTLCLATLAEYLRSKQSAEAFRTDAIHLKIGTGNPAAQLSAHRSLTFSFFRMYTVVVHFQPYDGSPRIAFRITPPGGTSLPDPQCSSTVDSWMRLPSTEKSMDSELSAAIGSCPAGMAALVKLLPHFKFLAFIDQLRQAFATRGFTECRTVTGRVLQGLYDTYTPGFQERSSQTPPQSSQHPFVEERPRGQQQQQYHAGYMDACVEKSPDHILSAVASLMVEKLESVTFLPPTETPELTRVVQRIMSMGTLESGLSAIITFSVDEWPLEETGLIVRILLVVAVRNSWDISETHVVVLRCPSNESMTLVAKLTIDHDTYVLGDGTSFDTQGNFTHYWAAIDKSLKEMSVQLIHITAVASLSPAQFPFFIQSLGHTEVEDQVDGGLATVFKIECLPTRVTTWPARMLFWRPAYCVRGQQLRTLLCSRRWITEGRRLVIETRSASLEAATRDGTTSLQKRTTAVALLDVENGVRLPAFFCKGSTTNLKPIEDAPQTLQLKTTIQGSSAAVALITFQEVHRLSDQAEAGAWDSEEMPPVSQWFSCKVLLFEVTTCNSVTETTDSARFSEPLSNAYAMLMSQLKILGFFLQGCRELQRLQLLRTDVRVLAALPGDMELQWDPWPVRALPPSSSLSSAVASHLSTLLTFSTVTFRWIGAQDVAPVEIPTGSNTVVFPLWWGSLLITSSTLASVLETDKARLTSQFQKATPWDVVRLVIVTHELHASINLVARLRSQCSVSTGAPAKLEPPGIMWSRMTGGTRLGSEDIRCLCRPPTPSAVPNIVEEIRLRFEILWSSRSATRHHTGGGGGGHVESDAAAMGHWSDPSSLCLGVRAVVVASAAYGGAGVLTRSFNETLLRASEGLSYLFQKGPAKEHANRRSPSLLGLYIPEDISSTTLDGFLSQSPPSLRHALYYYPGRLLANTILPLLETATAWANAVASTVSVSQKSVVDRLGVLLLSRQAHQGSKTITRKTTLGQLRWKTLVSQADGHAQQAPLPGDSYLEHTIELRIVPSVGNVYTESPLLTYMHSPIEPRDDVYKPSISVGACSSLMGNQGLMYSTLLAPLQAALLRQQDQLVVSAAIVHHDTVSWSWDSRFNLLLLPTVYVELTSSEARETTAASNAKEGADLTGTMLSYAAFMADVMERWRSGKAAQHGETKESKTKRTVSLQELNAAELTAESLYLSLYPCSLILPFETCFASGAGRLKRSRHAADNDGDTGDADFKVLSTISTEHVAAKRHKTLPTLQGGPPAQSRQREDGEESPTVASTAPHVPSQTTPDREQPQQQLLLNVSTKKTSDGYHHWLPSPEAYTDVIWEPPLRPHTAQRADGKAVELQFSCSLELKSVPALAEWTLAARYFRLFSTQACVDDFPFLIRLLQCCPGPGVADVASLLDLALTTTEMHATYLTRRLQGLADEIPRVPFIHLEFKKPPVQRQGYIAFTKHYVRVQACVTLYEPSFLKSGNAEKVGTHMSPPPQVPSPESFGLLIAIPLPVSDPRHVLINNVDLVTLLNRLPPGPPTPSLSLTLQRPLSKALAKLFSPHYGFDTLLKLFQPPAETTAATPVQGQGLPPPPPTTTTSSSTDASPISHLGPSTNRPAEIQAKQQQQQQLHPLQRSPSYQQKLPSQRQQPSQSRVQPSSSPPLNQLHQAPQLRNTSQLAQGGSAPVRLGDYAIQFRNHGQQQQQQQHHALLQPSLGPHPRGVGPPHQMLRPHQSVDQAQQQQLYHEQLQRLQVQQQRPPHTL